MTPTPEMDAMAERIADKNWTMRGTIIWDRMYDGALSAIVQTTKAASNWVDDNIGPEEASAIANGEHLK